MIMKSENCKNIDLIFVFVFLQRKMYIEIQNYRFYIDYIIVNDYITSILFFWFYGYTKKLERPKKKD